MSVKVIGVEDIKKALEAIRANLDNLELITQPLAGLMRDYVHVDSGDLQASINFEGGIAYADTPYAGFEADRGGAHDYAGLAIDNFDIEMYADAVVKPF